MKRVIFASILAVVISIPIVAQTKSKVRLGLFSRCSDALGLGGKLANLRADGGEGRGGAGFVRRNSRATQPPQDPDQK